MTLFLKGTPPPETEAVVSQVTALQQTYRMTREMRVTIFVRAAFSSDPVALTKDDDSDLMASLSSVVDSVGSAPLAQEALLDSFSTLLFDAGKIGFAPLVFKVKRFLCVHVPLLVSKCGVANRTCLMLN